MHPLDMKESENLSFLQQYLIDEFSKESEKKIMELYEMVQYAGTGQLAYMGF